MDDVSGSHGEPPANGSAQHDPEPRSNFDKRVYEFYKVVVPVTFSAFVLLGVLGNGLVIYVILSRRKLRTVTNLLLANLAAADVAFLVVCGSFTVVHYAMDMFPLGDATCRLIQYLLFTTCYVTVYTLVAVSAVRYVSAVHGADHVLLRRKRYVRSLVVAIWLVFLCADVPVAYVHRIQFDRTTNRTECIISSVAEGRLLFLLTFLLAYVVPLLVISSFYLAIVFHLRRTGSAVSRRTGHVGRVTVVVVMAFAVCWFPLHVHLLVGYYGNLPRGLGYGSLLLVWHILVFVNSAINPVIYNVFSVDFRNAFRQTFPCRRRPSEPEPEPV